MSNEFKNDFAYAFGITGCTAGVIAVLSEITHLWWLPSIMGALSILVLIGLLLSGKPNKEINTGFFAGMLIVMTVMSVFIMFLNLSTRIGFWHLIEDVIRWTNYFGLVFSGILLFSPKSSAT